MFSDQPSVSRAREQRQDAEPEDERPGQPPREDAHADDHADIGPRAGDAPAEPREEQEREREQGGAHPEPPGDRKRPRDRRGRRGTRPRTRRRARCRAAAAHAVVEVSSTPCTRLMSHSSAMDRAGVPADGAARPEGGGERVASRERHRRRADRPVRARVRGRPSRVCALMCITLEPPTGRANPMRARTAGARHPSYSLRVAAEGPHRAGDEDPSQTSAFTNQSRSKPSPVSGARASWLMP